MDALGNLRQPRPAEESGSEQLSIYQFCAEAGLPVDFVYMRRLADTIARRAAYVGLPAGMAWEGSHTVDTWPRAVLRKISRDVPADQVL
jgi:hypothetical protein